MPLSSQTPKGKSSYFFHWALLAGPIALIFYALPKDASTLLLILVGLAFLCAFLMRVFHFYPGAPEPLILDFLGMLISFIGAYLLSSTTSYGLTLFLAKVALSFLILLPHIIYISLSK